MTGSAWPFADLRPHHYAAILADPPWHFRTYTPLDEGNWAGRRDAGKHYQVMSLEEIAALPVVNLAAKHAHLFVWATGPHLPQALKLIEAWGFKYSGVGFTWVKLRRSFVPQQLRLTPLAEADLHVGLGHTTRKNAEFCLLARRGSPRRNAKDVREIVLAPVREHSRKPDEVPARIQRYCDGPYAELFARSTRAGWDCWGIEVDRFVTDSVRDCGVKPEPLDEQSITPVGRYPPRLASRQLALDGAPVQQIGQLMALRPSVRVDGQAPPQCIYSTGKSVIDHSASEGEHDE